MAAVLRKRVNWPRKRISKRYENAIRNTSKAHGESVQKRTDLKLECNKIHC